MVYKKPRDKYITLEDVRVTYNKKTGKIDITSKDPDIQGGFILSIDKETDAGKKLSKTLADNDLAIEPPVNLNTQFPNFGRVDQEIFFSLDPDTIRADMSAQSIIVGGMGRGKTPEELAKIDDERGEIIKDLSKAWTGLTPLAKAWNGGKPKIFYGGDENRDLLSFDFEREDLPSNLLVVGQPGSGKTMLTLSILEQATFYEEDFNAIVYDPRKDLRTSMYKPGKNFTFLDDELDLLKAIRKSFEGERKVDDPRTIFVIDAFDDLMDPREPESIMELRTQKAIRAEILQLLEYLMRASRSLRVSVIVVVANADDRYNSFKNHSSIAMLRHASFKVQQYLFADESSFWEGSQLPTGMGYYRDMRGNEGFFSALRPMILR